MSARSYGVVDFFARHDFRTHLLLNGGHNWYELRSIYGSKLTTFRDMRHRTAGIPIHDDMQIVEWLKELPPASDGAHRGNRRARTLPAGSVAISSRAAGTTKILPSARTRKRRFIEPPCFEGFGCSCVPLCFVS